VTAEIPLSLSIAKQLQIKLSDGLEFSASPSNPSLLAGFPREHQMIHEMCRKFADEELAPNAGKWDKVKLTETLSRILIKKGNSPQ
jgi:hypothetical protein